MLLFAALTDMKTATTTIVTSESGVISQPKTRPISLKQLGIDEVKGIHAGLFAIEAKCIDIAHSMMALLHYSVPAFEDTWIECLGTLDLFRMAFEDTWKECLGILDQFRIAFEDDQIRVRETWGQVAQYWYSEASKVANVERLPRHLRSFARTQALKQLPLCIKSLMCLTLLESVGGTDLSFVNPVLKSFDCNARNSTSLKIISIRARPVLLCQYTIKLFSDNFID